MALWFTNGLHSPTPDDKILRLGEMLWTPDISGWGALTKEMAQDWTFRDPNSVQLNAASGGRWSSMYHAMIKGMFDLDNDVVFVLSFTMDPRTKTFSRMTSDQCWAFDRGLGEFIFSFTTHPDGRPFSRIMEWVGDGCANLNSGTCAALCEEWSDYKKWQYFFWDKVNQAIQEDETPGAKNMAGASDVLQSVASSIG